MSGCSRWKSCRCVSKQQATPASQPACAKPWPKERSQSLTAEQRQSILEALQNCPAGLLRLRAELRAQSGQTMAEYALIVGGIALAVILAIVFLGGRIGDLFGGTGSRWVEGRAIG